MPPQGLQLLLALGQGWAGAESPFGGAAETPKCGELLLSPQPGLEQSTACDTLTWCAPPQEKGGAFLAWEHLPEPLCPLGMSFVPALPAGPRQPRSPGCPMAFATGPQPMSPP